MAIRFTIEERHLTDGNGRPVSSQEEVEFHTLDADSVDDAVRLFIRKDQGELIGDVLKFPGFQAIATVRKQSGVFTLQFSPSSQPFKL